MVLSPALCGIGATPQARWRTLLRCGKHRSEDLRVAHRVVFGGSQRDGTVKDRFVATVPAPEAAK